MIPACRTDPVACIDFVALFIGEFLKDWTTLGMLALLLALLFKLRADQQRAREAEYARQLLVYAEQRQHDATHAKTWEVGDKSG